MTTKIFALFAVGALSFVGCDGGDTGDSDTAIATIGGTAANTGTDTSGGGTGTAGTAGTAADTMAADTTAGADTMSATDDGGVCEPACPDGETCTAGTCFPDMGSDDGGMGPMVGEACDGAGEFCFVTDPMMPASCTQGVGCVLSCQMGATCPDGMSCNASSTCVYDAPADAPDPTYGDPAGGCAAGSVDLNMSALMWNVCAPACDGAAPNIAAACPAAGSGTAVAICGLTNGMGSGMACG